MFQHIYIEKEILSHPITQLIVGRFPKSEAIVCNRYTEIFNRKGQNFRLQKQKPALILAKKFQNFVLKTPENYGIGGKNNYYFSHMLNCIFDCRYCFLQGMYNSANYVLFINFEDFQKAIREKIQDEPTYFFSGYDCDSLALEHVTGFVKNILPLFQENKTAFLELRTKSTNTAFLHKLQPMQNVIAAFTLSPESIVKEYELKTPSLSARLSALKKLQIHGWPIGLRFDPIIYCDPFKKIYKDFFHQVFEALDPQKIHSVTLGVFRLPKPFFKNMIKLYPKEKLFAAVEESDLVSYPDTLTQEMHGFCKEELLNYIPLNTLFSSET